MLSCGINIIMWGSNVIMCDEILSCGGQMLSCGINVIMWDELFSCGMKCYHVESNVIMWDQFLWGSNVVMCDQCSHLGVKMLSCGGQML
jgi:hypothetical protein